MTDLVAPNAVQALSFALDGTAITGNHANDPFTVDLLSLEIRSAEVPVPGVTLLIAAGLVPLSLLRRR